MPDPLTNDIAWFHPPLRAIIPLQGFHCSRSLSRTLRMQTWSYHLNKDFLATVRACADRQETWISEEMIAAYNRLHQLGFAHSWEVRDQNQLIGGLYGVQIGAAFFAESMFHRKRDASKAALKTFLDHLNHLQFQIFEVQFMTPHLKTLGAIEISRADYLDLLQQAVVKPATLA